MKGVGIALALALAPRVAFAAERDRTETPDSTTAAAQPSKQLAGARLGVEATPILTAYYARFGSGIWHDTAETEVSLTSAPLTRFRGSRLRLQRTEPILRGTYVVRAIAGGGAAFSRDAGGNYWGIEGLFGLELQRAVGRWELGGRVAYLPVFFTHVALSDQARDTFADRYPDQREERGPSTVSLWFSGQRVQALLTARAAWTNWVLDLAGGLELSPLAGRYWANLEQGQLPVLLQIGLGRRF